MGGVTIYSSVNIKRYSFLSNECYSPFMLVNGITGMYKRGVKRGAMLDPILFGIYIRNHLRSSCLIRWRSNNNRQSIIVKHIK